MKSLLGFNLIELLVVLSIISILSIIGWSFYANHVVYAKRIEAGLTLQQLAVKLEQFYFVNNTYENATLDDLGFTEKIANNRYQLKITSATHQAFTLAAQPIADQAEKDLLCATLTLNSSGEKGISGSGTIADCW